MTKQNTYPKIKATIKRNIEGRQYPRIKATLKRNIGGRS